MSDLFDKLKFDAFAPSIPKDLKDKEAFKDYFKNTVLKDEASQVSGIVYVWFTQEKMPRVQGESKIYYIGKTVNSLKKRYSGSRNINSEAELYDYYYQHILSNYGEIGIGIIKTDNPKAKEKDLLEEYKRLHKELTPLNRQG
jgi:hypothetical protein